MKNTVRTSSAEGELKPIQLFWQYDKTYTSYQHASNTTTTGTGLELSCLATIHDGSVTFVKISDISSRPYGVGNGFVSWTQISSSITISSDNKTANIEVIGTLTTKSTFLGVETTYTYDHVMGMDIRAS